MSRSALPIVLAVLLLAGCATRGPLPAPASSTPSPTALPEGLVYATQSAREAQLEAAGDWHLQGRVAFAHGRDAATVRIDWRQQGEHYRITLAAPVTGRTLELVGGPHGARLVGLDGGPRESADAEALLHEATGWSLPVTQFPRWVRGARGGGPASGLELDAEGRPTGWTQAGWSVEYRDWFPGDPPLPRRLFAHRDGVSVRLVVEAWTPHPADPAP